MPRDHGLRSYDDQRVGPTWPYPSQRNPEQPIETLQSGARLLPLIYGELLSESG